MSYPWREHPALAGRFHPEYPDDLQVVVHDGGPRITERQPELVWVTVTSCLPNDVFAGQVLNQPEQLESVSQGSEVNFIVPSGLEYPLMVTDKYLRERDDWVIGACQQCGLDELFDAPSDLTRAVFPDLPDGAVVQSFTAFCGACGGLLVVKHRSAQE